MKFVQFAAILAILLLTSVTAVLAQAGDPVKGKAVFASKDCLRCHALDATPGKAGPSMAGVTKARQKSWLTKFIKDPTKMGSDPIVKELKRKYPVGMPATGLTDAEVADVIAYLDTLNAKAPGK